MYFKSSINSTGNSQSSIRLNKSLYNCFPFLIITMEINPRERALLCIALEFDINTSDKTLELTREKRQLLLKLKKEGLN